jgi:hypothetical protein
MPTRGEGDVTRQRDETELYHRQWLHAIEDDTTVDSDVLQVLRIYSDEAGLGDGLTVSMSRKLLHRLTHLSYDRLQTVHVYAEEHGWLARVPGRDGRSVYYALEIGRPGERRSFRGRPVPERSVGRTDTDPWDGSKPIRGTDRSNQSVGRIDIIRGADQSGPNRSAGRIPTISRERKHLSPRRGSTQALLATQETDVTEAEAEAVLALLTARGAKSALAVLHAELSAGRGSALVREVRQRAASAKQTDAAVPTSIAGTPSAPPFAALCSWCSRPGHDRDACPERAALSRSSATELQPAAESVRAEEQGDGREEFARRLAVMKARTAERPPVPAGPVDPDELRDVLPEDYGDGDHAA